MAKARKEDKAPILWQPHPRQAAFLACPDQEVLYGGAAGAGKSDCLLIDALGIGTQRIQHPRYRALMIRKTFPRLRELIDRSRALYPLAIPGATYNEAAREWRFPSGAKLIFGYLDGDADVYQYQGQEFQHIAFDELTQWASPNPYKYLWTRLRSSDAALDCYMRATTNPGGPGHQWVRSHWAIPDDGASTYQEITAGRRVIRRRFISARLSDNPTLEATGYGEQLLLLPDKERRALLEGRWDVDDQSANLINLKLIRDACADELEQVSGPRLLGVDPARFGDDRTAICYRQGRRVHWIRTRQGQDLMTTVGEVVRYIRELEPHGVFIDVCGIGAGVYDRLLEMGYGQCVAVNSAERAMDAERYANLRAEMWVKMRDWLAELPVQIPRDDTLHADLAGPCYSFDSNGRLKLEKKEDMKKRGLRSPDMADSLALTFARPLSAALIGDDYAGLARPVLDAGMGY